MSKFERHIYLIVSIIGYFLLNFILIGIVGGFLQSKQLTVLSNLNKFTFLIISWYYIKILHSKINGVTWKEYFSLKYIDLFKFLVGASLPIILTLVSLVVLMIFKVDYYLIVNKSTLLNFINSFITGLNEEFFFRCFIYFSLFKIMKNQSYAAFVSSIFFTFMHIGSVSEGFEVISLTNILVGSLLLCYLFYLTNSIWISIGFHAINNTIESVINYPKQTYEYANLMSLIVYTGLLLILLIVCILFTGKMKMTNRN